MNIRIILASLLSLLSTILYADNSVTSEIINAVTISDDVKKAIHVSFTQTIINEERDIQDIALTYYEKDKETSEIKITKASNCYYPKEFIKTYRKDKSLSGNIKHDKFDAIEIFFWCDNDVKFSAIQIIPGSKLEEEFKKQQPGKFDQKQSLSNGEIVMFSSAGYFAMVYEDVSSIGDPYTAIMARLTLPQPKAMPEPPRASGLQYSLLNQQAPNFATTMLDRKQPNLIMQNLNGKVWIMVSFASWCEPCLTLLKSLSEIKNASNAIWVGVNYDEDKDKTEQTMKLAENMFDYLLTDNDKTIANQYKISILPTVLIINKEGIIRYHMLGNNNLDQTMKDITEFIKQLN